MLTKLKNNKWLQSILVGFYGLFIAGLKYILDYFGYREVGIIEEALPMTDLVLGAIKAGLMVFVLLFFAYVIGKSCENSIKLKRVAINKEDRKNLKFFVILVIISSIIIPIITTLFDYFLFTGRIPNFIPVQFDFVDVINNAIYNPIFSGIIFRYALTSLLILSVSKVYKNNLSNMDYKNKWVYLPTILSVCLGFSINLSSVISMYDALTFLLFFRTLLVYFVMDVLYAYIYLKYGIKYSIITHFLYVIVYIGIIPLFCSFF